MGRSGIQIRFLGFLLYFLNTLKTVTLEGMRYRTGREQVSKEGLKGLGQEVVSVQTDSKPGWPHFLKQYFWANPVLSCGGLSCGPSSVCPTNLGQTVGVGWERRYQRYCPSFHTCPCAELCGMEGGPPGSMLFHRQRIATGTHWADQTTYMKSSTAVNSMTALF